jgi:hypothetical protein
MNFPDTKEEPESIEKSAQIAKTNVASAFNYSMDSSMYVEDDHENSFNDGNEMSWASSVEPFNDKKSVAPNGGPRRESVVMKPVAGFGGLLGADFDDIDYDDSDDDVPPKPKEIFAATSINPNHRPMVGGFAAAAYEAARADHFRNKGKGDKKPPIPAGSGRAPSV